MNEAANRGRDSSEFAYQVTVYYPDGNDEPFRFVTSTLYVGRDPENDLRLHYPRIAGRHLMVQVARRDFLVTDLGTAGETRFHGEELEPHMPYRVREGEMVQMGSLRLSLEAIIEAEIEESAESALGPRGVVNVAGADGDDYIPPRGFESGEDLRSRLDERLSSEPRRLSSMQPAGDRRNFRAWRQPAATQEPPLAVDVTWPRVLQGVGLFLGLCSLLVLVVLALL